MVLTLLKIDQIHHLDIHLTIQDQIHISLKDIYGREVSENHEGLLFYIYKSGKVEKRIILDK